MSEKKNLLFCYNLTCNQKFDPNDNNEGACQHHPALPVFHDTYKIWPCCNKKCIDFTEFLSIKGCTKSKHSNIKPPEPVIEKSKVDEVVEVTSKPLNSVPAIERPPFHSPQLTLKPTIAPALLGQIKGLTTLENTEKDQNAVAIGQSCKNNSCKSTYSGPASDNEICKYHPGVPIFHEGMKYWSCCQKKTTDFNVFMEQPGCTESTHMWIQKNSSKKKKCKMDWYQTGTHVFVSVYAKKYSPDLSFVKLNPIHLTVDIYFLEENCRYNLDVELRGIVDLEASAVNMLASKVEIKLKKKEPGSWSTLDIPRQIQTKELEETCAEDKISEQVDAVDLSDL